MVYYWRLQDLSYTNSKTYLILMITLDGLRMMKENFWMYGKNQFTTWVK